jgi:hypothetical protein
LPLSGHKRRLDGDGLDRNFAERELLCFSCHKALKNGAKTGIISLFASV